METNIEIEFSGSIMSCEFNWEEQPSKYNPNLDFANLLSLAFFKYFAFISIRKEAIDNIKIDLRSRNDALSSDKHFLFRKLVTC